ncbi:MAG TPA: TadE/TadG family type IV pilus assembly protein [Alphaproteobacteria bacterium]|jgi:hypothetical protein
MASAFLIDRFRRLLQDRAGSTLLEFAYAFPIIVMAAVALIELLMIMFVSSLMEGGLRDASRFGITGGLLPGVTREQAIIDTVNDRTLGLLSLTPDNVHMRIYKSFDQVGQPEPLIVDLNHNGRYDAGDTYTDVNGNGHWDEDMAASGAGGAGDVVVYDIVVDWPLLTPLMVPFIGENGLVHLGASIAVRNEPYPAPVPPPGGTS